MNQHEMIKQGLLTEPYKGVVDCFRRVVREEGVIALWRSNGTNGNSLLIVTSIIHPICVVSDHTNVSC
jgi:hypothetical protein